MRKGSRRSRRGLVGMGVGVLAALGVPGTALAGSWDLGTGAAPVYSFEEMQLSDRMGLKVNVATGNLLLEADDVSIAGTNGHDLRVGRFYNSLSAGTPGPLGYGWSQGQGVDVRLVEASGHVDVWMPSGFRARFTASGGSYTPPTGFHAAARQEHLGRLLRAHVERVAGALALPVGRRFGVEAAR